MKTPPKVDSEAQPRSTAPAGPAAAQSSDPPPPPAAQLPKIYGDAPPREGPFQRTSVWTLQGKLGGVQHEIACDSMQHPELRAVLRVLFAGSAPPGSTPIGSSAQEQLRIEWREHGNLLAVSRLLADGTLLREQAGSTRVDRRLSSEALQELEVEIERAQLRVPDKRWCEPEE